MAAFIIDSTATTPSPFMRGKENDLNVLLRAAEAIQQADSSPTYPKIAATAAGCGINFTSERPSVSCPRLVSAGSAETSAAPRTYNSPDGLSPKDWCITMSLSDTSQQPTATTSTYNGDKQEDFAALLCKEILPKKAETAPSSATAPKKESGKSAKRPRQSSEEELLPLKKKRNPQAKDRKLCSVNDCSNISVNSGVCYRHGATRKICKIESCTLVALQKGVCLRHGAKHPRCKAEGCTKQAQNGGVCRKHGAKVKLCSSDGCSNKARRGGVCIKHGAVVATRNAKDVYATDMAYRVR